MFYTAFEGGRRILTGELEDVKKEVRRVLARGERGRVLVFEDLTGRQVDFDLRSSGVPLRVGPGRPKLGVVSREVSLLPRQDGTGEGR